MTPNVWRDGDQIRKRAKDEDAAHRVVCWTEELRARDIATPPVSYDERNATLTFPLIEGTAGLTLIEDRGVRALYDLLRPLRALHRVTLDRLAPFNPAAKILPRLTLEIPTMLRDDLHARLGAIAVSQDATLVHGDFHAGQLILDTAGTVWLLDLEDLATGALESDLGNFAAHLATRPETRRGPTLRGFEHWLDHILEAYRGIGGVAQTASANSHGRIALIRRALKLRERGDPSILDELSEH